MPVEAFLPQVGVQASLLFLRRKSQDEMDAESMGNLPDYTVFMAVAEKVGHDRRGVTLFQRDANGAEVIFPSKKTSLRRRKNRQLPIPVEMDVQEKKIDDDLPRIGKAYFKFQKTGQVDE